MARSRVSINTANGPMVFECDGDPSYATEGGIYWKKFTGRQTKPAPDPPQTTDTPMKINEANVISQRVEPIPAP